jgi:hypothetical protein
MARKSTNKNASKSASEARTIEAPRERWQHGTDAVYADIVDARDPASTVRVQRLDNPALALERSGRVGGTELSSAKRFADDYSANDRSPYIHPATAGIRGSSAPDIAAYRIDAATRVRRVRESLGDEAHGLLVAALYAGLSIAAISRRIEASLHVPTATQIAETERRRWESEIRPGDSADVIHHKIALLTRSTAIELDDNRRRDGAVKMRAIRVSADLVAALQALSEHYADEQRSEERRVKSVSKHAIAA